MTLANRKFFWRARVAPPHIKHYAAVPLQALLHFVARSDEAEASKWQARVEQCLRTL